MTGDQIEIKLRDSSFNKIFYGIANINKRKEVISLLKQLKSKGVDLIQLSGEKGDKKDDWFT